MRNYITDLIKKPKFIKHISKNRDFLYEEDGYAIFAPPRAIKGNVKVAFKMKIDGNFSIGQLNDSCKNFEKLNGIIYPEEINWIKAQLNMVEDYVKSTKRRR